MGAAEITAALADNRDGLTESAPKSVAELFADVPYEPEGALRSGFSSRKTGPATYEVTVVGSAATPLSRLTAIAYARAAEIGVENNWPNFRATEIKRTARCDTKVDARRGDAPIFGGYPVLTITVSYGAAADGPEVRDAAETFAEMRSRLDQTAASEDEKQAIVGWVFSYCASTGSPDPSGEPGR